MTRRTGTPGLMSGAARLPARLASAASTFAPRSLRARAARHLGAEGGVLIFDKTGQAKKGTATAAAGRQYSGTMGRGENVIVAVYTTYTTDMGHALIDRDLYVQHEWFTDPERMAAAGFDEDHTFATKPEQCKHWMQELCVDEERLRGVGEHVGELVLA